MVESDVGNRQLVVYKVQLVLKEKLELTVIKVQLVYKVQQELRVLKVIKEQ